MKKQILIATSLALLAVPTAAHAKRRYGRGGCGLGNLIFGPSSMQCSAASTNSFYYTNTFSITSGTSNCVPANHNLAEEEQETFFVANFATLSREAAQGAGDSLAGFAGTLGCAKGREANVAASMKANYHEIFAQPGAVAAFDTAIDSLRASPEVAAGCEFL